MTTALVPVTPVQLVRRERATLEFTPEQRQMIRDSYANGASESEFIMLLEIAKAKRLNPLLGQIHFVKRWDNAKGREVWATQTGIDGFRSIAEDTGLYDGQDEPDFKYVDDDPKRGLLWAKVRVYRKDITRAFTGRADFAEYVQTKSAKNGGGATKMWAEKPHIMLAKCAEALAFRKAFPLDLGDIYTHDELPREEHAERITRQMEGAQSLIEGPAIDWTAEIARSTTRDQMEDLAERMKGIPKGAQRDALSKLYKARWKEVVPQVPKEEQKPEMPKFDDNDQPPPPASEEREPGAEG